jgi:hypothetical protein
MQQRLETAVRPSPPKRCDPGRWLREPREKKEEISKDAPDEEQQVLRELNMLNNLMEYRDGAMSEAIAQVTGIIPYFQGLVGFR